MLKLSKDIYGSVFLIAVSIVMYVATYSIQKLTVSKIGADFMPRIIAIAIFVLSLVLLVNSVKQMKQSKDMNQRRLEVEEDEDEQEDANRKISPLAVVLTIVLMIVYISLLKTVGFLIMTAVYLFLQMYFLADKKEQKIPLFVGVSIITSISVYFCFKSVFHLMLPAGILG
ncbi:tripartite tricarboxylate transporter TctB family protein [Metabacillus herbersteinensis]|uniref:Tripartite tricarboxylate transporter TctB family protein n=1 Tax=Metabacillus herbersteinensis TaxID=283816 RepID=A0ABV6GL06_9BACI